MKARLGWLWAVGLALVVLVGIPILVLVYQSQRTGMSWSQIIGRMFSRAAGTDTGLEGVATADLPRGEKSSFLKARPIGDDFTSAPRVSHLATVDLDADGLLDVVVCDSVKHAVTWIRQRPRGEFTERTLADGLIAPAHVEAVDIDKDGDNDLVLAVLGMLFPNNDRIGSVVVLENDGDERFTKHVLADRIARVSDVRAGDLDGDGDLDLAVAQFGYDDGESRWMENLGDWKFKSHMLQNLSGPVNCELADIDADGDLDMVELVSQEWEEIYVFVNDGHAKFEPHQIYGSTNDDFGSSGICTVDLDGDGDLDILYTNGDAFDYIPPRPRPWHGVQWLENEGGLNFTFHRITDFAGAFSARPLDVDRDGDLDIFVVSAFNRWEDPEAQSFIWLENNGRMRFRRHDIASSPTHILVLDTGDFDADGDVDMVTGGMHTYPPNDRMARIMLWENEYATRGGGR